MIQTLGTWRTVELIGLVILAGMLIIATSSLIGAYILRPLNQRAGRLRAPTRFQLSDFCWLLVQLQVSLAYAVQSVGYEQTMYFWLVFGFLLIASVGMWAGAVSFMSRAGVLDPKRRAVFILALLPLTLTLMIGGSMLLVIYPIGIVIARVIEQGLFGTSDGSLASMPLQVGPVILATVLLTGLGWGLRRVALWILASDRSRAAELGEPLAASGEVTT